MGFPYEKKDREVCDLLEQYREKNRIFRENNQGKAAHLQQKYFGKKESDEDLYLIEETFDCVTFQECVFENVCFKNCRFRSCVFENCYFEGGKVVFQNCNFQEKITTEEYTDDMIYYAGCEFISCNFNRVEWINCVGSNLVFENNIFTRCYLLGSQIPQTIMKGNSYYSMRINNCDINSLYIIEIGYPDFEFHFTDSNHNVYVHKKIYVSKVKKQCLDRMKDYETVCRMYYTLLDYLEMKNLDTEYISEYRYLYNFYSMKAKPISRQWWDRFSWAVCGFGEKLNRFVIAFASVMVLPAFGYLFGGIQVNNEIIRYSLTETVTFSKLLRDFGKCLHFSIITFSTVGYGNVVPYGNVSYVLSVAQIIMGLVFTALFTSIMLNKILR